MAKAFVVLILVLFSSAAFSHTQHLELELSSREYAALLKDNGVLDHELSPVLETGKRFLDWLIFINSNRPAANQISLTSPATQPAYPVEEPGYNNIELVLRRYQAIQTTLPRWMKEIVFDGKEFIKDLPEADSVFIAHGFELDRIYQSAARWTLQEPYLFQYKQAIVNDVRGYYFLSRHPDLMNAFETWQNQTAEEKTKILSWLKLMCRPLASQSLCDSQVNSAKENGTSLKGIYNRYEPRAKAKYKSFFTLTNARRDITWTNTDRAEIPFIRPEKPEFERFMADNVEDEWKWLGWGLHLNFVASGFSTAHLVFEAGATPHVDKLGGNTITMDANTPLTEYGVQWTIRHEFGHVLGFPDCYVEFYDEKEKAMINYQLDITDLMCSRRGKLKQTHFDEMKRAYYKGTR